MDHPLAPGVLVQGYRVQRELGRGGMGVVYLATDERHRRRVALKVLDPALATGLTAERFLAEIRTTASLAHPHIVPLLDSGEHDGALFYVMPYLAGESLEERLEQRSRLAVDEAVGIAIEMADALAFAHRHGVVHRDVKPGNILLVGDRHATLADFGIAHAVARAASSRLTRVGAVVGTPDYMSPEQAAGKELDGRSDIYSLGLVLYEMLAGQLPADPGESRGREHAPPSVRSSRVDVPEHVDRAVRTAMAQDPDARFADAGELARALRRTEVGQSGPAGGATPARRRRWPVLAAAVAVVAAIALAVPGRRAWLGSGDTEELDSLRYAVLPFSSPSGSGPVHADLVVHEALGRWDDIQSVDRIQVADAVERMDEDAVPDAAGALRLARSLGAGRYIRGAVTEVADSIHVEAVLHDANSAGRALHSAAAWSGSRAETRAQVEHLVERLLLGGAGGPTRVPPALRTRSLRARRAYEGGHRALEEWDLTTADSLFVASAGLDPSFALALLWRAQVGDWLGETSEEWHDAARRAAQATDRLPERERRLALGLLHLAERRYPDACSVYDSLRTRDSRDFAAWYGLGQCRARDPEVRPDRASPSGFAFRASRRAAIAAYEQAFELVPASHRGYSGNGFERIRDVLFTRADRVVVGRLADGSRIFLGWPALVGDTLAFLPYPPEADGPPAELQRRALVRQRETFHEIARHWTQAFPRSPHAFHALAVALDMLGDPAALDTLTRARRLAGEGRPRVSVAASEVWMRLKRAAPDDLGNLRRARSLADSILTGVTPRSRSEADRLAALAELLGRSSTAAALTRMATPPSSRVVDAPTSLRAAAHALTVFAAVGGPPDSVARLEETVEDLLRRAVPVETRDRVRIELTQLAAMLAYPERVLPVLRDATELPNRVARAQSLFARGDSAGARALLTDVVTADLGEPQTAAFDTVLPQARLWRALGNDRQAEAVLARALEDLNWSQPGELEERGRAASLVRAFFERAELARVHGEESEAARWGSAALAVWPQGPRPTEESPGGSLTPP